MKHNANRLREIAQNYQHKEQAMIANNYQQDLINHYADQLPQWVPTDNAELATFCAIAIELMRTSEAEKLRDAARLVEMRHMTKGLR